MVAIGSNGGRAARFTALLVLLHRLATFTIIQAFQLRPSLVHASSSSTSSIIIPLNAISRRQTFIIDGGELQSFLVYNSNAVANSKSSVNLPPIQTQQYTNQREHVFMEHQVGLLTFVVGTTTTINNDDGSGRRCRVVGVEKIKNANKNDDDDENDRYDTISLTDEVQIYKHTMATIPSNISDMDALSTAAATVVGVHCAIPKVEDIGGSSSGLLAAARETNDDSNIDTSIFYSGKAVVLGGNDYAIFVANGLATLGINVSLVTTAANNVAKRMKNKGVKVMSPASSVDTNSNDNDDDDNVKEVGFATIIGQFDSLIDTISNEKQGMIITDTNTDDHLTTDGGKSNLFTLLQSRHQCNKYVSTMTHSQQLIKTEGILFGPGKVNSYVKSTTSNTSKSNSNNNSNKCLNLIQSPGFGPSTLQVLLENNVIYYSNNKNKESISIRKWEIQDFWEETSWPRDNSGTGIRYGLPVLSDDDDDDDELDESFRNIDQPLSWAVKQQRQQKLGTRVGSVGGMDEQEVQKQTIVDNTNPYVTQIVGIDGLATNIIYPRRNSVVFVAMRSCRTCSKSINTMYTKLARDRDTKGDTNILFAKADATGSTGRALGKQLGIVAVPSFVLFRNGLRYGAVFTSKLPNDRLDQAIRDMEAGKDFDVSLEEDE